MRDEQIIEAMAWIDDQYVFELTDHDHAGWKPPVEPAYLTSQDAAQRPIDGMDAAELRRYALEIGQLFVNRFGLTRADVLTIALQATPRQKCEAILKAKGMWQKD